MAQEDEKKTSAEVEAAPDVPSDQAKVSKETPKASTAGMETFVNKVKIFGFDASTGAVSDEQVLAADSGSSGGEVNVASDYANFPGSGSKLDSGNNRAQRDIGKLSSGFDANRVLPTTAKLIGVGDYGENSDALFEPAFHTNDLFQLKGVSAGEQNQFGTIYRRTPVAIGTQKLVFARGQVDDASLDKLYPTASLDSQAAVAESLDVKHGNYLLQNMKFTVADGVITDVTFTTKELPAASSVGALRTLTDHTKSHMLIAQNKISEWTKQVAEGGRDYYPPIVNGTVQPARHLALAEDIVACDGVIAYAAAKSICESYAYAMHMRSKIGGRKGSTTLAAMMASPITAFADGNHYGQASTLKKWNEYPTYDRSVKSMKQETIASLLALDRKSGWNSYLGSLISQPMFKSAYEHMLAAFDSLEYKIDVDTCNFMNKAFGWFKDPEADVVCGVDRVGIVLPYDPATYFDYVDVLRSGEKELDGACHIVNAYNSKSQVLASIGSPLFKGMCDYFRDVILPMINSRVGSGWSGTYVVDFDFPTNRFSAGAFFIALAMPQIVAQLGIDYVNGYYTEFQKKWGVDPFADDTTKRVTTSDVLNSASFRGLGVAPVMQDAPEALLLMLSDPEFIIAEGRIGAGAFGEAGRVVGTINYHPGIPNIGDSDDASDYEFGKPVVQQMNMILPGVARIMKTPADVYYKTRDLPIHMYNMNTTQATIGSYNSCKSEIVDGEGHLYTPGNFVGFYTADGKNASIKLTVDGVTNARRITGRYSPAPCGMLDGATVASKMTDICAIQFTDKASGGSFGVTTAPLETYDYIYLLDDGSYEPQQMGSATYLDAYMITTGGLTSAQLTQIVLAGFAMDTPANVNVSDNKLVSFQNPNHSSDDGDKFEVTYKPEAAYKLWPTAFAYPFMELPTTGVCGATATAIGENIRDDRSQLQLNEAFGLKFFGMIDFSRYTEWVRKQRAAPDAYLTNWLERQNNLFA